MRAAFACVRSSVLRRRASRARFLSLAPLVGRGEHPPPARGGHRESRRRAMFSTGALVSKDLLGGREERPKAGVGFLSHPFDDASFKTLGFFQQDAFSTRLFPGRFCAALARYRSPSKHVHREIALSRVSLLRLLVVAKGQGSPRSVGLPLPREESTAPLFSFEGFASSPKKVRRGVTHAKALHKDETVARARWTRTPPHQRAPQT